MTEPEQSTGTPDAENSSSSVVSAAAIREAHRPLYSAVRWGTAALLAAVALVTVGAGLLVGMLGVWGGLLGGAVGGFFCLTSALGVLATARVTPTMTMAVVLGGWLLKLVVTILVILGLRQFNFYDHTAFGLSVIISLVIVLGAETVGVLRSRALYVVPEGPRGR